MEENLRGKITFQGKNFFLDNILNSTAIKSNSAEATGHG